MAATRQTEGEEPAEVLLDFDGPVATVTLNRPLQRHAFTAELLLQLLKCWQRLEQDEGIRAVVLTASGDRAFSAGADLKRLIPLVTGDRAPATAAEQAVVDDPDLLHRALLKPTASTSRPALGKPLVAAINGAAVGGGFELALAADLRLAVPTAHFALPEIKRAIVPSGGAMARLPRQLPKAIALELLLTGEPMSAERARHWGLVNDLVAPETLLDRAQELASTIAAQGPLAVAAIRRSVEEGVDLSLAEAFALEEALAREVMASEDAREGPRAWQERRPPRYRGR